MLKKKERYVINDQDQFLTIYYRNVRIGGSACNSVGLCVSAVSSNFLAVLLTITFGSHDPSRHTHKKAARVKTITERTKAALNVSH